MNGPEGGLGEVGTLAELLHETADHHDGFEKATAKHDWWDWYAPYLEARLQGRTSEQATTAADRYMAEVRGVVRGVVEGAVDQTAEPPAREVPTGAAGLELKTILVALDGSASSRQAMEFAFDLAAQHHAQLLLVHVVPALDLYPDGGEDVVAVPHEPTDDDHVNLDEAAAAAADRGVLATTALIPAAGTAEAIVDFGESNDVDLIVIGSCGHGAVRSTLLGSVSLGVLRKSDRPVVLVRGDIAFSDPPRASAASPGSEVTDRAS